MMLGISISANATFRIENSVDLGGNDSAARALNNQGDVVGDSLNKNANFEAFLHQTETGIQKPGTPGGTESFALEISDSGQISGSSKTIQTILKLRSERSTTI